jgi:hypothetical protein
MAQTKDFKSKRFLIILFLTLPLIFLILSVTFKGFCVMANAGPL